MRTDCKRDKRQTFLRNASTLGYDTALCKRGFFVQFDDNGRMVSGRVLGGATALGGKDRGVRYIEVAALLGNLDCLAVRWVHPDAIARCTEKSPLAELMLLCGGVSALEAHVMKGA